MIGRLDVALKSAAMGAALALSLPLMAQQPAAPAAPPVVREAATVQDPIRFTAFAVSMQAGMANQISIAIERWSTDAERQTLLNTLAGANFKSGGQANLLKALQAITPRVGFIRAPNTMGWDLKYAWENALPDGTRQIVIASDKPVSFLAGAASSQTMDYPFSFVEMRMKPNDKGEGRMLAATAIAVKDGKLALENYGLEPIRLTTITEVEKKPKK